MPYKYTGKTYQKFVEHGNIIVALKCDTSPPYFEVLATTTADASGNFTLEWEDWSGRVIIGAVDDEGTVEQLDCVFEDWKAGVFEAPPAFGDLTATLIDVLRVSDLHNFYPMNGSTLSEARESTESGNLINIGGTVEVGRPSNLVNDPDGNAIRTTEDGNFGSNQVVLFNPPISTFNMNTGASPYSLEFVFTPTIDGQGRNVYFGEEGFELFHIGYENISKSNVIEFDNVFDLDASQYLGTQIHVLFSSHGNDTDIYINGQWQANFTTPVRIGTNWKFYGRYNEIDYIAVFAEDLDATRANIHYRTALVGDVTNSEAGVPEPGSIPGLAFSETSTLGLTITANDFIYTDIVVSGQAFTVSGVRVTPNLTHAEIQEVQIYIQKDGGPIKQLWISEYSGTALNEQIYAPSNLTAGGDRYSSFLDDFIGVDPNGTWTLIVVEATSGNDGTLIDWTLELFDS